MTMNPGRLLLTGIGISLSIAACSGDETPDPNGTGATGGSSTGGTGGATTGGGAGKGSGGGAGTGVTGGGSGAGPVGGGAGMAGSAGSPAGGAAGSTGGGAGASAGSAGSPAGGAGGTAGDGSGGAMAGSAGASGSGGGTPVNLPPLVTSAPGAYWKIDGTLTDSTATATVTVNDTQVRQTWTGFGGSFNERGWKYLTSQEMKDQAIRLLFSAEDGANLVWGRIPIGASDYGDTRYTLADTGEDVEPNSGESNRPPADNALASFSLTRDGMMLIPYIKAAQALKPGIRFWASPWTPPVWMKTGYMEGSGCSGGTATPPSYFDGGNMKSDTATLTAYADYFERFVDGYAEQGINVEVVSPQNEPGYEQNYPSCLWDATTYTTFIRDHLGPAMMAKNIGVMLGTMSNAGDCSRNDISIADAVLQDSAAAAFLTVAGVQWGVLDRVKSGQRFGSLPIWATEHKCGNYPWNPSGYPMYVQTAPNDQAYAVESWGYIRGAIVDGGVTSYSAWNMVLDRVGLGNDTTRHWAQNALLVADGGMVTPTPFYHVFRHLAQYVAPGAQVVGTTGGEAVAFKNPDGGLVAVMFNSGGANANYVVAIGTKKYQFSMPQNGWATVYEKAGT
jgi:glucosylceramidase